MGEALSLQSIRTTCAPYAWLLIASAWVGIGVSYSDLYLFHIALGLYIWRCSALIHARGMVGASFPSLVIMPLIFFAWMVVSTTWAANQVAAIQHIGYHGIGTLLMLLVVFQYGSRATLHDVLKPIVVVLGIELSICTLEVWTQFRYPISPYSERADLFGHSSYLDVSWTDAMVQAALSSPTGFHWNPNSLAIALVIVVPFLLFARANFLRVLALSVILATILFTASRGSYIACLAAVFFWAFAFSVKRAVAFVSIGTLLVAISVVAFSAISRVDDPRVQSAIQLIEVAREFNRFDIESEQSSIGTRFQLFQNGIVQLAGSSGLGVGGGNSRVVFQDSISGEWQELPLHNFWLEVIVEGGVLIGTAFIAWFLYVIWRLFLISHYCRDRSVRYMARSSSTAMVALIPAAVSASSIIYFLPLWLLLGISIATIRSASEMSEELKLNGISQSKGDANSRTSEPSV